MSHNQNQSPAHSVAVALSQGHLSVNAQVSGRKGNPNPTLLSQLSTGSISLSALNASLALVGWGGE